MDKLAALDGDVDLLLDKVGGFVAEEKLNMQVRIAAQKGWHPRSELISREGGQRVDAKVPLIDAGVREEVISTSVCSSASSARNAPARKISPSVLRRTTRDERANRRVPRRSSMRLMSLLTVMD